jgi:hypothetical protein
MGEEISPDMLERAIKASKEADAAIRKKRREESDAKQEENKITIKGTMEIKDPLLLPVIEALDGYLEPVIYAARFKNRGYNSKYQDGFLMKVIKDMPVHCSRYTNINLGVLRVEYSYDEVTVSEMGTLAPSFSSSVIGTAKTGKYVVVHPNPVGILATAANVSNAYPECAAYQIALMQAIRAIVEPEKVESDLAGYEKQVDEIMAVLTTSDPRVANRHILLFGPPGCGKSSIVKEIIKKTPEWIHFNINTSACWESTIPGINCIASAAGAKLMILIDEIDEIGLHRDVSRDRVYQLLRLMDGVENLKSVRFIATTNRPNDLDPALLRTGRFGPIIFIDKPTEEQFEKIVRYYADKYSANIDIAEVVRVRDSNNGCDVRTAFENCIIFKEEMSTANVIAQLRKIQEARNVDLRGYI